jgi:hypothetical protein
VSYFLMSSSLLLYGCITICLYSHLLLGIWTLFSFCYYK